MSRSAFDLLYPSNRASVSDSIPFARLDFFSCFWCTHTFPSLPTPRTIHNHPNTIMPSTSTQACDIIFSALVGVLTLVYLCFQGYKKRWNAVLAFIIIFALLWLAQTFGFQTRYMDWRVCLLIALVGSNVVALPQTVYAGQVDAQHEGFVSGGPTKRRRKRRASGGNPRVSDSGGTGTEPTKKNSYVDTFSTFMETYKSLNPHQIEKMSTDTRELIQTQKSLMDTVKSFAPVLREGREMMSTFKEYFGEGADAAVTQAIGGASKE